MLGSLPLLNLLFGVTIDQETSSMRRAAQDIANFNGRVDFTKVHPYKASEHFDSETIKWSVNEIQLNERVLMSLLAQTNMSTSDNIIRQARVALGTALHTLQDFYAHTNWVELGNTQTSSSLVPPYPPLPDLQLPPNIADVYDFICSDDPSLNVKKLTSGYYDKVEPPIPQKCIHGGVLDPLTYSIGFATSINKDSTNKWLTPNGTPYHTEAVRLATQSTIDFVTAIKSNLLQTFTVDETDEKLRALFGIPCAVITDVLNDTQTLPKNCLTIASNNMASFFTIELDLDDGSAFSVQEQLLPLQSAEEALPDLSASTTIHNLVVTGIDSLSITGLIGYTITLPSTMEFVNVVSDRGGLVDLSGQHSATDLFVLVPQGGPPHAKNTYTIRNTGQIATPLP
jgi:hypothetical protein